MSSDPDKNTNAAEDFFHLVGKAHIIAAAMKFFSMDDMNGIPQRNGLSTDTPFLPKEEKSVFIHAAVLEFVKEYICLNLATVCLMMMTWRRIWMKVKIVR